MKTFILPFVALLLPLFSGCQESGVSSTSVAELENWLTDFETSISTRTHTEHHSDTLLTEHGVFIVSTQPGTVDDKGLVSLAGESRTHGYFIAPRMVWVDSIQEAKRVMIEDMKANKGLPVATYTGQAEQDVTPNR